MRKYSLHEDDTNVDMTPMLDIVFIMLIFFIVTTSFTKEKAIDVTRPTISKNNSKKDDKRLPVPVQILDNGTIRIDGNLVASATAASDRIAVKMAENPRAMVIIQAHENAKNKNVIEVIDAMRNIGIESPLLARLPKDAK